MPQNIVPPLSLVSSVAAGSTSNPTTTSASFVLIPEMTVTASTRGTRPVIVLFAGSFQIQSDLVNGDMIEIALFVDGVQVAGPVTSLGSAGGLAPTRTIPATAIARVTPSPGSHTYEARWRRPSGGGTCRCYGTDRKLAIQELEG